MAGSGTQKQLRRWTRGLLSTRCCIVLLVLAGVGFIIQTHSDQITLDARVSHQDGSTVQTIESGAESAAPRTVSSQTQDVAAPAKRGEIRQGGAGSNDVRLKDNCSGPMSPNPLPENQRDQLKKKLIDETHAWGYFDKHQHHWEAFKGQRVLDVGMGQGPICVVAVETGVLSYTGLDPALCIDKKALTRHKKISHVSGRHSCKAILNDAACLNKGKDCPAYKECWRTADSKYQLFPFTAIEMMAAYKKSVTLLPGTFETLKGTDWMVKGMFDIATLWSVTEHLPNNRLVLEGIFKYLEPGKVLRISHHNFYGYDGHHEQPKSPAEFEDDNAAHRQLANWKHLEPGSFVQNKSSLNRVRLGDLMATVDVYFRCAWVAVSIKGVLSALTESVYQPLQQRGFNMAELLVSRWHAACERRVDPLKAAWVGKVVWHHPPLDGSYKAQPLPRKLHEMIVTQRKKQAEFCPEDRRELRKFLPK